ncbi:MAG: Hsp33 family molecular chaperone HslO [Pseudomonadota bacterium]
MTEPSTDFRRKFLFESLAVRGELVRLDATVRTVLEKHPYPPALQALLAEALAAAALLAGTLKFEGLLILQAKGIGPLTLLMAECSHDGRLRAIARYEGEIPDAPLASLLGEGHLAITIDPTLADGSRGQRYQGIVPLDGISLAECIEHYFSQSEQLGTRLWLVTNGSRSAGLMLQELPGAGTTRQDADAWNRLCRLTDTLTAGELLGLPPETLLQRLFHEDDVRLFDAEGLMFACSCSQERVVHVLRSLGETELRGLLAEQGFIDVTCEFCNQHRYFEPADIENLLRNPPERPAPGR